MDNVYHDTESGQTIYYESKLVYVLATEDICAYDDGDNVKVYDNEKKVLYGTLPKGATAEDVINAVNFYEAGRKHGIEIGRSQVQLELRKVLGMSDGR